MQIYKHCYDLFRILVHKTHDFKRMTEIKCYKENSKHLLFSFLGNEIHVFTVNNASIGIRKGNISFKISYKIRNIKHAIDCDISVHEHH